ncbi:MAG: hypothetical protein MRERV_93c002 [Mycoplasmataceae bacterium RV_VA103A]|nr:MAG: hypothetical protein MRERV_93c002 [Mycoplasmataceae bacterium RV_VA103A]
MNRTSKINYLVLKIIQYPSPYTFTLFFCFSNKTIQP